MVNSSTRGKVSLSLEGLGPVKTGFQCDCTDLKSRHRNRGFPCVMCLVFVRQELEFYPHCYGQIILWQSPPLLEMQPPDFSF